MTALRYYYRNIFCLYFIKLAKWLMLVMPIVALFYTENGLSSFDIYVLQGCYSISVALLEIPSGYMADIVGRKRTLLLGSILGAVGYFIYFFSHSLSGFLIAEITLGFGGSFISGADSAMLYDSLIALRRKHYYLQYEGRITSLGNFAETIAAVGGGIIAATLSYRAVYLWQAVIASVAIPASLLLVEPPKETAIDRPGWLHILAVCRNTLVDNSRLSCIILLSSVTGVATLCMAWTCQMYFIAQGFTEKAITPLWVTLNLTVALVAVFTPQAKKILGNRLSLVLIVIYLPGAYILLGLLPLAAALLSLFLFYAVRGYATPVLKDLINQNCDSATRATVLSIRSLIIRFGFALLGPLLGMVAERFSFATALVIGGSILLTASIITGIRVLKFSDYIFHR